MGWFLDERYDCPKTSAELIWENLFPLTERFHVIIIICLCPQLNIYTPVPSSAQAQFVPESPGFIQSGITTTRESILPFFQAVKVFSFAVCFLQQHIRLV